MLHLVISLVEGSSLPKRGCADQIDTQPNTITVDKRRPYWHRQSQWLIRWDLSFYSLCEKCDWYSLLGYIWQGKNSFHGINVLSKSSLNYEGEIELPFHYHRCTQNIDHGSFFACIKYKSLPSFCRFTMYLCTSYLAGKGRTAFRYIIVLGMIHLKTRGYVAPNNGLLVLFFL